MLQSRIQRKIPERLSHYTNIEALKSILSDQEGKGMCLWAFSNRHKNDDQEIRMGEYLLKRILETPSFPKASLLHQFGGYENTASFSFMEGEVNKHMLEYGSFRLEFDLRELGVGILAGGLIDCEYVPESDLKEYADEYCNMICQTYNSILDLQKKFGKISSPPINNLISFFMMENDIMTKVLGLKEQQWSEEMEWRKVFEFKNKDEIRYHEGKPYIEYYLDKHFLTGITVFYKNGGLEEAQCNADDIQKYIFERGYKADVKTERFG